jgi:hypothetical protein
VKVPVRALAALILALITPLPALAQTHVIAQLGTSPLVGQIASTPQLQTDVAREQRLFRSAGAKLGLTPWQYTQFESRIASRDLHYVTIPRRLDAMSWAAGGKVYVLRDVLIPAGTQGWEVDLEDHGQTIALFVPARCGNLSLVRRPVVHLARAPLAVAPAKVIAAITPPPLPAPVAQIAQGPTVILPDTQQAAPPYANLTTPAAAVHRAKLWPLLLLPILAFLGGSHGGSIGTVLAPPTLQAPGQQPGCPTPSPKP